MSQAAMFHGLATLLSQPSPTSTVSRSTQNLAAAAKQQQQRLPPLPQAQQQQQQVRHWTQILPSFFFQMVFTFTLIAFAGVPGTASGLGPATDQHGGVESESGRLFGSARRYAASARYFTDLIVQFNSNSSSIQTPFPSSSTLVSVEFQSITESVFHWSIK